MSHTPRLPPRRLRPSWTSSVGILLCSSQTQRVLQANTAAAALLGLPQSALRGIRLPDIGARSVGRTNTIWLPRSPTSRVLTPNISGALLRAAVGSSKGRMVVVLVPFNAAHKPPSPSRAPPSQPPPIKLSKHGQPQAAQRLQARALMDSAAATVILRYTDDHYQIEYANPAFARLTGYSSAAASGHDCGLLQRTDISQDGLRRLRSHLMAGTSGSATVRHYRADGSLFWDEVHLSPLQRDDGGAPRYWVAVMHDVTASVQHRELLEYESTHDILTGLPNRASFHDRLDAAVAHASRYGEHLWLLLINLDRFQLVNDTQGQQAGDVLLHAAADRLRSLVRQSDTVARLGGDTFAVTLHEQGDEHLTDSAARTVIDAVLAPLTLRDTTISITSSVGVACYPADGIDADVLFRHGEFALHRAKESGRNKAHFFNADQQTHMLQHFRIEQSLRQALAQQQLSLNFQPRICAHGLTLGMEALVRWHHPELGHVPPAQFIPIAEESEIILALGNWVIKTACRQNQAWQDAGFEAVPIAVNVSARQFRQTDFAQLVQQALTESCLAPHYLELELTETAIMQDIAHAAGTLAQLRRLGVRVAIDDFGTGYSSLSYLHRLPLDYLKIDQSFVQHLEADPACAHIVDSIIALGHSLDLRVIAEGVETDYQLGHLLRQHCDEVQGFLVSRPVDAESATQFFRRKRLH